MQIEYVNHSIGNNFGETIELNENLKKYPKLHRAILNHELKHSNKQFSKQDLMLDLTEDSINTFELISFMLKYPKSFKQFLPVYKHKKYGLVYDINLLLIYITLLTIILISVYLGIKI